MSPRSPGTGPNGIPDRPDGSQRELVVRQLSGSRALVLDVDDTIVDTRAAMIEAGAAAMAAVWPERIDDHAAMAEHYFADPGRWFARYARGELEFTAMRAGRLQEVAVAFAVTLPAQGHDGFEGAYAPAFLAAQRLFPDVDGLLDAADELGLPVALLTNSSSEATAVKLGALAIAHRFVAVVTTDTLGVGKPDPRTYHEACRLVGATPQDSVCIGDNLEWDVVGARAAGLRAVWLDRHGAAGQPDIPTVASLHEVTAALREWRFGQPTGDG